MLQFSVTKSVMVFAVVLASIFFALPNMLPSSVVKTFPSWWQPMNLGLDLRGGSYLLLEVDISAVLKEQLADLEESSRAALRAWPRHALAPGQARRAASVAQDQ